MVVKSRVTPTRSAQESPRWHARVPYREKLRPDLRPRVVASPRGPGTMLVPTPLTVAEELHLVPRGEVVTTDELRQRLAKRFGADRTCPLTTGIVLHILAGATEEDLLAGRPETAPYWRVVDRTGCLNPKWPPGPARQAEHLRSEGRDARHDVRRGVWRVDTKAPAPS